MIRKIMSIVLAAALMLCLPVSVPAYGYNGVEELCSQEEWELLRLINHERYAFGQTPLSVFPQLQQAAQIRAAEIVTIHDHLRPSGSEWETVLSDAGIAFDLCGEIIDASKSSPEELMSHCLADGGRMEMMMDPAYTHGGFGYKKGGEYIDNWAQVFISGECHYTDMRVHMPEETSVFPLGTTADGLGAVLELSCSLHGICYMPVISPMCRNYNADAAGEQQVTVCLGELTAEFSVTLAELSYVPVTGVALNTRQLSMKAGEAVVLKAQVIPSDATDKGFIWETSDEKVVTVDSRGNVLAVGPGFANIVVTARGGTGMAGCFIRVEGYNVCGISLTEGETTIKTNTSKYLSVVFDPPEAANKTVIWVSGNKKVASVNSAGKVTGLSNGTAVITALSSDGGYKDTCTVTVEDGAFVLPFNDVSESDWFYDGVYYASANAYVTGINNETFAPGVNMTRAMAATVIYRIAGDPAVSFEPVFTDVPHGMWYSSAVIWASRSGIVEGVGGGKFDPDAYITREQLAAILYRYASYSGYDTSGYANITGYNDAGKVSTWAFRALGWAVSEGLIKGVEGNKLDPQGYATRAQCAVLIANFLSA